MSASHEVGPKLDALDENIHELSRNLEIRLTALSRLVSRDENNQDKAAVTRLQVCVQSAATVFSAASTDVGDQLGELSRVDEMSETDARPGWEPDRQFHSWIGSQVQFTFPEDAPIDITRDNTTTTTKAQHGFFHGKHDSVISGISSKSSETAKPSQPQQNEDTEAAQQPSEPLFGSAVVYPPVSYNHRPYQETGGKSGSDGIASNYSTARPSPASSLLGEQDVGPQKPQNASDLVSRLALGAEPASSDSVGGQNRNAYWQSVTAPTASDVTEVPWWEETVVPTPVSYPKRSVSPIADLQTLPREVSVPQSTQVPNPTIYYELPAQEIVANELTDREDTSGSRLENVASTIDFDRASVSQTQQSSKNEVLTALPKRTDMTEGTMTPTTRYGAMPLGLHVVNADHTSSEQPQNSQRAPYFNPSKEDWAYQSSSNILLQTGRSEDGQKHSVVSSPNSGLSKSPLPASSDFPPQSSQDDDASTINIELAPIKHQKSRFWRRFGSGGHGDTEPSGLRVLDPKPRYANVSRMGLDRIEQGSQSTLMKLYRRHHDLDRMPLPKIRNGVTCLKVVLVGDGACGKTSFINVFSKGAFPEVYVPTVMETYTTDIEVDGRSIELGIWDTAGQEDYVKLRPLAYHDAHVFMVCYDISEPDGLDNIKNVWLAEIRQHCPNVPLVLVGLKLDAREDKRTIEELFKLSRRPVGAQEALFLAEKLGCFAYQECSAKTGEGVKDVWEITIRSLFDLWGARFHELNREKRRGRKLKSSRSWMALAGASWK